MKIEDLYNFNIIDDPQISNDGNFIAYTETIALKQDNNYCSKIVIYEIGSKKIIHEVSDNYKNCYPRWNKQNELIYLNINKENNTFKINILDLYKKSSRFIFELDKSVIDIQISGCDNYISFLKYEDDLLNDDHYLKQDVLFLERFNWKSDSSGFNGNSYKHLYIYDLKNSVLKQLTNGKYDINGYAWSNKGSKIAIITNKSNSNEFERKKEIYLISNLNDIDNNKITELEEIRGNDISFSPNDDFLTVCGHDNKNYGHYGLQKIWLINVNENTKRCLTANIDISFGDYSRNYDLKYYGGNDKIKWSSNGNELYALSNEYGYIHLNKINIYTSNIVKIFENKSVIYGYIFDKNEERFITLESKSNDPANLFMFEKGNRVKLTCVNDELISRLDLRETEEIWFKNDGVDIVGWINHGDSSRKNTKPILLYNGGGPGGMRSNAFVFEFQYYSKLGFTVINCNARGNYGHGEEYSLAIKGHWGDLDVSDNIAFLNNYIKSSNNDGKNLFTAGGSYGGYITNWMICEHPNIFSAAVVDRTVFNRSSFFGTSDIGFQLDKIEHSNVMPWENINTYFNRSPISKIKNIKIPTMVVHSAKDYRCTVDQGDQLFAALKYLNIKTKYIRFFNENHDLNRLGYPKNKIIRINEYVKWFEENIK
jgi:dipeptidyl aminopeptidase/acylaminoacyl peptidase